MFGKLIRKYIPAIGEQTTHHVRHRGSRAIVPGKMHRRQGGVLSGQLRVVCGECNHGWMRETQEAGAPHLIPLLAGNWTALGPSECSAIASWFTLFSMVDEFVDPKTGAITQAERTEFMTTQKPPKGWTIMIGRFFDKQPHRNGACNHFGLGVYEARALSRMPQGLTPKNNTQITAVVMGRLILYGVSTTSGEVIDDFSLFSLRFNLPIIWPNNVATQIRPPVLIHNYRSWSDLSNDFMKRHNQPHFSYR